MAIATAKDAKPMSKNSKTVKIGSLVLGQGRPVLCASLGAKTAKELKLQAELAAKGPAQILEIRADVLQAKNIEQQALSALRLVQKQAQGKPLLFTWQPQEGELSDPEFMQSYMRLNRTIMQTRAVDIIDIALPQDTAVAEIMAQAALMYGTRLMFSYHNFAAAPTKKESLELLLQMNSLGAKLVKLAATPKNAAQTLAMLSAAERYASKKNTAPATVVPMGKAGYAGRIAALGFGSAIAYGHVGAPLAPHQPHIDTLAAAIDALYPAPQPE